RAVADEEVPETAQESRTQCLKFLETTGGPVLSVRRRTTQAIGSAASGALGAVRGRLGDVLRPSEEQSDSTPTSGSATTPGITAAAFRMKVYVPSKDDNSGGQQ